MVDKNRSDSWVWGVDSTAPNLLHTMLRVGSLERSLDFYCGKLGMKVIQQFDFEQGRFSLVFLSFSGDYDTVGLELTYNWDVDNYHVGNGYGHIAIGVPDFNGTCGQLKSQGVEFISDPMKMLPDAPLLAIIKDPDGYAVELIQTNKSDVI